MLGGGAENARLENAAPKLQDWKMRDWNTRERIGYGKPLKPKQPTHFQTLI